MLIEGPAKKVTFHISEDAHHHGEPLYLAVLNYLFAHGASGASVSKGVAGFGASHRLHTTRILELSEHLPVTIEFIDTAAVVDELMPALLDMAGDCLVEIQDTTVLRVRRGKHERA